MTKENQKTYLGAAVLMLAFAALSLLSPEKEAAAVEISEAGFKPEVLNIEPGTKVIFKNTGKQPHWPASNYHPTHELYPEFDAKQALAPGKEYSFIFKKPGSWPAHDHIFPGLTMVINVGSVQPSVSSQDFRTLNYDEQKKIIKSMAKEDPAQAWSFLKSNFTVNGEVVGDPHEFAHIIGNIIYSQRGIEGIRICDDKFAYGCFHGVTEQFLLEQSSSVVKAIQDQCLNIYPPQQSSGYTGCIHGIGHGLFTYEGLNIKPALSGCDLLSMAYRGYCYDGVFMENYEVSPEEISLEHPWDFCESLHSVYHFNCARYVGPNLFRMSQSTARAAEYCRKSERRVFYETCYENLGYEVSQRHKGGFDEIRNECFSIRSETGRDACIIGAAVETIFQEYVSYSETSDNLCKLLENEALATCIRRVNFMKKEYKR